MNWAYAAMIGFIGAAIVFYHWIDVAYHVTH